jgi:hypothetical protein
VNAQHECCLSYHVGLLVSARVFASILPSSTTPSFPLTSQPILTPDSHALPLQSKLNDKKDQVPTDCINAATTTSLTCPEKLVVRFDSLICCSQGTLRLMASWANEYQHVGHTGLQTQAVDVVAVTDVKSKGQFLEKEQVTSRRDQRQGTSHVSHRQKDVQERKGARVGGKVSITFYHPGISWHKPCYPATACLVIVTSPSPAPHHKHTVTIQQVAKLMCHVFSGLISSTQCSSHR